MLNDMFPFHFDKNLPHAPENARLNPLQLNTVWFGVPPSDGSGEHRDWPPEGGTPNRQPASSRTV
jgi:hypothetical protein